MIDLLLLLMAVIWGTNYSIVKSAFQELDPAAFNAARMVIASAAFLGVIALVRVISPGAALRSHGVDSIFRTATRLTLRDGLELVALGLVGHFLYQYFFIGGLALTTVANSSLMLATTPVVIALISAVLGQERVGRRHWAGAALSLLGVYIVVGRGVDLAGRGRAQGRPDDGRGGAVLGCLHPGLAPSDLASLAGRSHGAVDVDRHPGVCAR